MTEETVKPKINYKDIIGSEDRITWLCKHNQWKLGLTDEDACVRLRAYRKLGFTKKALKDEDWRNRLEAYRALGFTEKAFKDESPTIRIEAGRELGFTEETLRDDSIYVRSQAWAWFEF